MFLGNLLAEVAPGARAKVQREADMDLLWRLVAAVSVYLIAVASLGFATPWRKEHGTMFWSVLASVGFAVAIRAFVFLLRERLYARSRLWVLAPLYVSIVLSAGTLGIAHVAILHAYGLSSWTYSLVMMWMLGITTGSTISFTPNFTMLLVQLLLFLGPTLPYDLLKHPVYGYSHAVAALAFLAFQIVQGYRLHSMYWTLLKDRSWEEARNRELEAAKLAAEVAQKGLRFQATHDTLTGILNRGQILSIFEREFVRAVRNQGTLGLVMFDLDHFKLVNDQFGHLSGDEVLCAVARRVESSIRPYDALGRFGGEEFLVVLPECDLEQAFASAERIRQQIERNPIPLPSVQARVTASFGVTVIDLKNDMSERQMLGRVDRALYAAKRNGRNRVEVRKADPLVVN